VAKEQKILSHNSELEQNLQESQKNLSKCTQSEASLYANKKELQKTLTELTANCTVCNNYITFLTSQQQNQNEKLTTVQLTLQNCTSQLESIKHNFTVVNSNLQSCKLDYESRLESLTDNVTLCYVTTNNTVYQLQHRLQSVQQNLSNCTSQRDTLYIQEQEFQSSYQNLKHDFTSCTLQNVEVSTRLQNAQEKMSANEYYLQNCNNQLDTCHQNITILDNYMKEFPLDHHTQIKTVTDQLTICTSQLFTCQDLQKMQNLTLCTKNLNTFYAMENELVILLEKFATNYSKCENSNLLLTADLQGLQKQMTVIEKSFHYCSNELSDAYLNMSSIYEYSTNLKADLLIQEKNMTAIQYSLQNCSVHLKQAEDSMKRNLLNFQDQMHSTTNNFLSCINELSSAFLNLSAVYEYNTKLEADLLVQEQNITDIQYSLQNCSTYLEQTENSLSTLTVYLETDLLNNLTSCSNELSSVYFDMSTIHDYQTKLEADLLIQEQNLTDIQYSLQNCSTRLKKHEESLSIWNLTLETDLLNLQNQLQSTTDNLTSCSNELSRLYLNMSAIYKYNTKCENDLLSQKQNMTIIQDALLQNCSTYRTQTENSLLNMTKYLENRLLDLQDQLQSTTDNLTSCSIQLFDTQNYQSNNRYIIQYYLYFVKIYT
jgi:chromosome segregation ATPase